MRTNQDSTHLGGTLSDWGGRALCLIVPLLGLFVLQQVPGVELTPDSILSGHWLTLWTGHLLHYTLEHFAWDALMFVIFSCLLWEDARWNLWGWLLAGAPMISIFIFWAYPDLPEYRGLSALDTMLYVRFSLGFLQCSSARVRWMFGVLPFLGLSVKIVYECISGQAFFVSDLGVGVVPLPLAHFAGLMLGSLWAYQCCGFRAGTLAEAQGS